MSVFTVLFVILGIARLLGFSVFHVASGFIHILLIMQSIFSSAARLRVGCKQWEEIVEPRR